MNKNLVNCKTCGKEIGENVKKCIHCGTDQRNFFLRYKIITLFIIVCAIGAIGRTGVAETNKPTSAQVTPAAKVNPVTSTATTEVSEKPIQVTAKQLEQEYDDNQFAADGKYKGKLLEVTGVPIAIDRDFSNNPYINLSANGNGFTTVWCSFSQEDASSLAKVNKNHEVTVQGICDGIDSNINLEKCKVITVSSEPIPENNNKSLLYDSQNKNNEPDQNTPITGVQAIQIVKQIVKKDMLYQNDHEENVNGIDCYVIHVYEVVNDGGGAAHTATAGWYAVQKNDGKVYDNILDPNHLHPLN
ncbi:hypothetical protein [Desulfosporosinus sp. FKB]|uniref:OB-fold protein n=1 Tax=Desulfosporosinus sp. FKB TaxID=1969835 RepID=UPI000B49A967|nr:hypothetical protein [Desulfosporosinus sp. FKB]